MMRRGYNLFIIIICLSFVVVITVMTISIAAVVVVVVVVVVVSTIEGTNEGGSGMPLSAFAFTCLHYRSHLFAIFENRNNLSMMQVGAIIR